ncbi:lysozyme inhibitor LprI family protein [Enterobacter ludwigii]
MKFMKFIPAVIALTCTANAYAGFFSSSDDFKCGRDDAVKALQQHIKDGASEMLQNDSLKNATILLNKPSSVYTAMMNTVAIDIKGASTLSHSGPTEVACKAKVSIALPKEAVDVLHAMPERIADIQTKDGTFYDNAIIWKDYSYDLKLSDDQKDISVTDNMDNVAPSELYFITLLAVNKDEAIKENNKEKLQAAREEYRSADTELNSVWKDMPDSVRASMKSSQLAWVKEKATKCGKISDAMAETNNVATRINILNCQTKMTNERIAFLGGNN